MLSKNRINLMLCGCLRVFIILINTLAPLTVGFLVGNECMAVIKFQMQPKWMFGEICVLEIEWPEIVIFVRVSFGWKLRFCQIIQYLTIKFPWGFNFLMLVPICQSWFNLINRHNQFNLSYSLGIFNEFSSPLFTVIFQVGLFIIKAVGWKTNIF